MAADVYTTSNHVHECRTSLNEMALRTLGAVHGTCKGNIMADELARNGTNLSARHIDPFCGIPLDACKHRIDTFLNYKAHGLPLKDPKLASFYSSPGLNLGS